MMLTTEDGWGRTGYVPREHKNKVVTTDLQG